MNTKRRHGPRAGDIAREFYRLAVRGRIGVRFSPQGAPMVWLELHGDDLWMADQRTTVRLRPEDDIIQCVKAWSSVP